MRIMTTLPQRDLRLVPDAARAAEAQGYDGVVTLENRHEPFMALGVAAVATETLQLATGVAIAFPRSPMVTASTAWDLQLASRGRFVLGIGPQVRAHNENRFSVKWTPPAPRLREYVKAMRAIWRCWETGEKLKFEGEHYRFTLMTPNFTPESMHLPMVPVELAAVGPHTLRLAGEVADGVRLHAFCTRTYLEQTVMPKLAEGWAKSGRTRRISRSMAAASSPPATEVDAKKVDWVRMRVASTADAGLLAGARGAWPRIWAQAHACPSRGMGRDDQEISDDVVRLFAAVGTHREIANASAERFAGPTGAASATSEEGADLPPDVIQDIKRIRTDFTGYGAAW